MGDTVLKGIKYPTVVLKWPTPRPVWALQWSLEKEKLHALKSSVKEQLPQGHMEPSTSPWNTLVFITKKKSGKWRLLHDLSKNQCSHGKHGCFAIWYAISYNESYHLEYSDCGPKRLFFLLFLYTQMIPPSLLSRCHWLIMLHQSSVIKGRFYRKGWETAPQFVNGTLLMPYHQ